MKKLALLSLVVCAAAFATVACGDDAQQTPTNNDAGPTTDAGPETSQGSDAASDSAPGTGLPVGFHVAVPWAATGEGEVQHLSMALDDQGDPLVSYMRVGGPDANQGLYFTRWDRAAGAFTKPLRIAATGNIEQNVPHRETSLAFDASTKAIGIAYQNDNDPTPNSQWEVRLALSTDGGKTFSTELLSVDTPNTTVDSTHDASLVMANGAIHAVYGQDWQKCLAGRCNGGYYATRAAGAATFTRTELPLPVGADDVRTVTTDIALDANGAPGILYFVRGPGGNGHETRLMFWRPGSAAVEVMSTLIQNDVVSMSLAFDGTKPRVATHLRTVNAATYDMRYAMSDDGVAWTAIDLPRAGTHTTAQFQSISIKGPDVVIAAEYSGAGDKGGCGGPKLLRSKAGGAFEVGCPDPNTLPGFAGRYVNVRQRADGKLALAFVYPANDNDKLKRGLIVWREP